MYKIKFKILMLSVLTILSSASLAKNSQLQNFEHALIAKPSPKHIGFILPKVSQNELITSARQYVDTVTNSSNIKDFSLSTQMMINHPLYTWNFEELTFSKAKRVLIVANRTNDHIADELRIKLVTAKLRKRGLEPYLLPVGATHALNEKQRENFHRNISEFFQGVILLGGADLDPQLYNEPVNGAVDFSLVRDELELSFVKDYLKYGKGPILGICRGSQLLAVAHGCHLQQDIPTQVITNLFHGKGDDGNPSYHPLIFQKTSKNHIANSLKVSDQQLGSKSPYITNSTHHQYSVIESGSGLEVVATSEDGGTEIFEDEKARVIGIQSHPEADDPTGFGEAIFDFFQSRINLISCEGLLSAEAA